MKRRILIPALATLVTACGHFLGIDGKPQSTQLPKADTSAVSTAWQAWRNGNFHLAMELAASFIQNDETNDEAHHVLALCQHILGDHAGAIETFKQINSDYRYLTSLDEPILWSYVHLGDFTGAYTFADRRGLLQAKTIRKRLALHMEHPLHAQTDGLSVIPFSNDSLSEFMPGFPVKLNGHQVTARLDTGGAWVSIPSELAETYGVKTVACEREFASMAYGEVCYGVADFEIGKARFTNIPVEVISHLAPAYESIAREFAVEVGPIIGTNVLRHFLATIDTPGQRIILSKRGNEKTRKQHLALLPPLQHSEPFGIWEKHLLIAKGRYGNESERNFFIDSGLVMATKEEGQAALMVPQSLADAWQLKVASERHFAAFKNKFGLGNAGRPGLNSTIVPNSTWEYFGDWGGINVEALVSYGYLKHFIWTLDFDKRTHWLTEPLEK